MICGACGGFYNQACPRWPSCYPAEQPEAAAIAHLRAEHDRRVTELLEANNREVERRRSITRALLAVPADPAISAWWDAWGDLVGEIMNGAAAPVPIPEQEARRRQHNVMAGPIVRSIVAPIVGSGGGAVDILVLLESVVAGVIVVAAKMGGDETVTDKLIERVGIRVKEIAAQMRLGPLPTVGSA